MGLLRQFQNDERGNIIITAAILLPVSVGAVGAAVTYSSANATRTGMIQALDAAVIAGAAMPGSPSSSEQIATAQNFFQNNLQRFGLRSATGIAATFSVDGAIVAGEASGLATNPFAGVIGSQNISLTVRAAATKDTVPVCVLGLNGLDKGSFDINGNARFNAPKCAVQANSTDRTGMTQEGNPQATAKRFGVTGGHTGTGYSVPPTDGSAAIRDPYASLPFPDYDACNGNKNGTDVKNDRTLSPGTYCGGIHVFGNANVTLRPGIYVMVDGPFWIDGNSTVTGDQVLIAFTGKGSTLEIWGDSTMQVTSPTSGTYTNMQFMQDKSDDNCKGLWVSVGGNGTDGSKLQYDGVAYFPTQNFWVFGNAVVDANSPSMAIVADKIWTQGNATTNVTNNNTRNLKVTAPQASMSVRLIY